MIQIKELNKKHALLLIRDEQEPVIKDLLDPDHGLSIEPKYYETQIVEIHYESYPGENLIRMKNYSSNWNIERNVKYIMSNPVLDLALSDFELIEANTFDLLISSEIETEALNFINRALETFQLHELYMIQDYRFHLVSPPAEKLPAHYQIIENMYELDIALCNIIFRDIVFSKQRITIEELGWDQEQGIAQV